MPVAIFLICLLFLPFVEIAVFIAVGAELGIAATLALTILSAIAGVIIVRSQGVSHLRRLQQSLRAGEPPLLDLLHTVLLLFAGFCLLLPGFVTDTVGVLLLIPPIRTFLAQRFLAVSGRRHSRRTIIIEGEAWERTPDEDGPGRLPHDRRP